MTTLERLRVAVADRYRIERELGAGGMATVYLAHDVKHNRKVALKVLRPELTQAIGPTRFLREIETTANLRHPHIVPLYDSGEADGVLFYVMPYVEGESLRDRLDRERQLPIDDAVRIAREVADALGYAHERGVIHRDIKPENILLERGHATVADFGIARALGTAGGDRLTQTGATIGTPSYMSPEQSSGEALDGRSDLYSLACVLYEMLAGEPPYTGATVQAIIAKRLTDPVPRLRTVRDTVSPALEAAVTRALGKSPADRFASAAAFAEALADAELRPSAGATVGRRATARRGRRSLLVAAALGLAAVATFVVLRGVTGSGDRPGLVVLPFENLGVPEDEYFADGMTEEVTSRLTQITGLAVTSRMTARQYKGSNRTLREIGAELGVAYVLGGTVRTDRGAGGAGEVRVTPQLIRVADDTHLWSEGYTAALAPGDVFTIQAEIAERVARALNVELIGSERQAVRRVETADTAAHDAYLQGRYHWNKRTAVGLERAVEHFTVATERDPQYARAWAGLADSYALLPVYRVGAVARSEAYRRSEHAARRAMALDSTLAEPYASLGFALTFGAWDWQGAERAYQRAIALEPSYPVAHYWYAELLLVLGRADEAVAHAERAARLAPAAAITQHLLGWSLAIAGHLDSALTFERKALELEPGFPWPYTVLGMAALLDGRHDEAQRLLEQGMADSPPALARAIADAWRAPANRPAAARTVSRWASGQLDQPAWVAIVFGLAGATDSAVAWFELAFHQRAEGLIYSTWYRPFVPEVVDDPRIVALRRRAGLPG